MKLRRVLMLLTASAIAMAPPVGVPAAQAAKATAAPGKSAPAGPGNKKGQPTAPEPIVGPIDTEAKHAFIIEVETGTVLLDKGSEERIPPASMSKVMTAYLVFKILKEGRAKLTDELPVSEKAWRTGGSKMFVPIGGKIKIDDLLRGMIVQSGNDACIVLAEGLAGSEQAFVDQMNDEAKRIGLKDSHFADVDGLPHPEHWMTARDLATLAQHVIRDFPQYYHYFSEKDYGFNNINQGNRNPLLYKENGSDGLKTGHTDEAGYSLLGSAKRDKRRIILVLNGMSSMKMRAQESERLLEWAFREFSNYQLFTAGDKVDDAAVWLGNEPKVALAVDKDVVVTLSRKARKDLKVSVQYDQPVPAPVSKGQKVGKVVVTAPDMQPLEIPLVTAGEVDRMGAVGRMATVAARMIWGNRR